MADTFTDVSQTSATNYLFLFAQRTLAYQDTRPTPPPLNTLGVPFNMIFNICCLLRGRAAAAAPNMKEKAETLSEEASVQLKTASANAAADKSHSSEELPGPANEGEDVTALKTGATEAVVAEEEEATDKKKKIAEKMALLAQNITEYILDHEDKATKDDRWRTSMKRDMVKSFREQRAASEKNFHAQHEESDKQREAIDSRLQSMHEVHSKMDEKLDRIVKDLASRY